MADGTGVPGSLDRVRLTQELHVLLIDYWHDVDTNWGRNAPDYYTEDAVFEALGSVYRGREQIRAFYQYRLGRGARVAVHGVSNFRIEVVGAAEAVCTWYLFLYAADGVPVLPTHPPIQVSLMTDRCVGDERGRWRVAHRTFEPWFAGGTPVTNPALEESKTKSSGADKDNP